MIWMQLKRDLGFDLIRLLSFLAISVHHFIWVVWYTLDVPASQQSSLWMATETYARLLSFSGHTILFLSCFLIARAEIQSRKTWNVVLWVLFGWLLFCLFEMGANPVFWIWDIYPLIALGLASALLLRKVMSKSSRYPPLLISFVALSFLLTWIPFWNWPQFKALDLQWRHWLIGDCNVDLADWPILPWIGFAWMAYGLGAYALYYSQKNQKKWLSQFYFVEYFVWPLLIALAIPNLGAFYHIILGPQFACFSFRQEPFIFWSHFICVIFFLRLSLWLPVQNFLAQFSLIRWISGLKISTHFGIAYLVHYVLIEACKLFGFKLNSPDIYWAFLCLVLILPATELCVRGLVAIKSRFQPLRSKN